MNYWFRGKWGGAIAFVAIAALVVGGLGWVTADALRLEREQIEARANEALNVKLREALWLLDSRVWPVLAREDSRPYNDYSAFYSPYVALGNDSSMCQPGTVVLPSPLLNAELPEWMLLHFRTGEQVDWGSPQVLSDGLQKQLVKARVDTVLDNVTPERKKLLKDLAGQLDANRLLNLVQQRGGDIRLSETTLVPGNPVDNKDNKDQPKEPGKEAPVQQGANANPAPTSGNQPTSNPSLNRTQTVVPQQPAANPTTGNRTQTVGQQQVAPSYNRKGPPVQQPGQQGQDLKPDANQNDFEARASVKSSTQKDVQQSRAYVGDLRVATENALRNGENWFTKNPVKPAQSQPTVVNLSPMVPLWLGDAGQERLIVARLVQIGDRQVCQGILLDWHKLQEILADEVSGLFPQARFQPVRDEVPPHPERTMTALPIQLEPGPMPEGLVTETSASPWTPLRVGLSIAWAAALLALMAVGLGGWTLIDLSQRRIRFVSAVTHELRTPLTTLRLYLDMLTGGIVKDEQQKAEYLQTLHGETDRLNRLVGNVLDFSRLENQRPRLEKSTVAVADLLEQVRSDWTSRCASCEKELIVENALPTLTKVETDDKLVQQILGNLIDNACKYARDAADRRVWLRARLEQQRLVLEVEDRGPGVAPQERRSIFRPFRRGHDAETTGGVGLGLALARRWASLLGGKLSLHAGADGKGACFRLRLPT